MPDFGCVARRLLEALVAGRWDALLVCARLPALRGADFALLLRVDFEAVFRALLERVLLLFVGIVIPLLAVQFHRPSLVPRLHLPSAMWGIIPAAGIGSRIQPLAFSKELLPVGSRSDHGRERPCAVSEYLIERMLLAGATKFCFVISPGKSDILEYYGGQIEGADVCYVVQPRPAGLCDALFRARSLMQPEDSVLVGLPDTIWFPADGLARLNDTRTLSFLMLPVRRPELFDAVLLDETGNVRLIQVKQNNPLSNWVWGAFRLPGDVFHSLFALWQEREQKDEYFGTLVNAFLEKGGKAVGVCAGETYVDVGTVHGYREALQALAWAPGERPYNDEHKDKRIPDTAANSAAGAGARSVVP